MEIFSSLLGLLFTGAVGVSLFKMVRIVPQQQAWVIERLGKFHQTLEPGLHILIPFIDRLSAKHHLQEIPYDVDPQICITKDNTQVTIDGILYYQVTDPYKATYGTSDFEQAIEQLAKTTLRSQVGRLALDTLLESRDTINNAVISVLDEATIGWGVKVLRYEVKDITPPDSVLRAMQMQITAEREKRAKIAESEGEKQKQINLAEAARISQIERSVGERESRINHAKADAEAINMVAKAQAQALETIAKAISTQGGSEAMQLKLATQYIDQLGHLAKTNNTMILPSNLTDVASVLATAKGAAAVVPMLGSNETSSK